MSLSLQLHQDPTTLVPGQVIEGSLGWRLDNPPKSAVLRLFWYTEGRGTMDVEVVEDLSLPTHLPEIQGTFRLSLPAAPYSFQGQLISLRWAIELILNNGKQVERLPLIVSPWVEQVTLKKVE